MAKLTGLGRGLSSLIPKRIPDNIISEKNKDFLLAEDSSKIFQIPVDAIEVNPMQPRKTFGHEDLEELIESIKVYGIIQPIIATKVEGGYQLIAGERRLRAARIIGLETVPAIVRQAEEQEKLELAIIENVQRKSLNPIEKAVAYQRLMDEFNLTQEQVAQKLGVSRSAVANTVRLLGLTEEAQKAIAEERLSEGHAKVLVSLENEKEQNNFLQKILLHGYTVRDTEQRIGKSGLKRKQRIPNQDPLLAEKEDMLRSQLNTKVKIIKRGELGQIVIEFYSEEELSNIIEQIIK